MFNLVQTLALLALLLFLAPRAQAAPLAQLAAPADARGWQVEEGWTWEGPWFGGPGSGDWHYARTGSSDWSNYRVDCLLRLDQPTDQLQPRWEGGYAAWVFAAYHNNAHIGGYEASLVLRERGDQFYRVMFSAAYQEVLLWSSWGGFLQVKPFAFEPGREYRVSAATRGPQITVSLDGRLVIDYWDRTVPQLDGGIALGRHSGEAYFSQVRVEALPETRVAPRPHRPRFRFREWKGAQWAWDGDEPIFLVDSAVPLGHEAKLVPGYQPQLPMWWYWLNYGDEAFYANKLLEFNVQEEGPRLRFELVATDRDDKTWLIGRTEVTVTYDPAAHRYVYDQISHLIIPEGHSLRLGHPIEFTDPVIHGHVGSSSPNRSWPTPHPWSVYKHESGRLGKLPHNHVTWYPGFSKPAGREARAGYLQPQGGFWALVGDPVANPVFIVQDSSVPGSEFYTELCGWAFDVHMRWYPVKSGETLGPGTYTVHWQTTTVDGDQADAWLAEAELIGCSDPDKELLLFTAGIGNAERFDRVVKWASPFYEYPWGPASLQDRTVGREDSTSLRLDGPRSTAGACVGGSVFGDPVHPGVDYEVSVWVKLDQVQGDGPGLSMGGQEYFPGLTGTSDWQRIGFVCRPGEPLHTVPVGLHHAGSGTVWFDDFMIRELEPGEQPAPPIAPAPQPLGGPGADPEVGLRWTEQSEVGDVGRTLLDLSGHGRHGRLEETARLVEEAGRRVLEFDAGLSHVMTDRALEWAPPQSFAVWVKPGALTQSWNMVATGGAWNRAWLLFLYYQEAPYGVDFRPWGRRLFAERAVPGDQWSHLAVTDDGQTISLYVNGELVTQEAFGGPNWSLWSGPLVLGTWLYFEEPDRTFQGHLREVTYWNKALTAAEVRELYETSRD